MTKSKWHKIVMFRSGIPWEMLKGAVLRLGGEGTLLVKVKRRAKADGKYVLYVEEYNPIILNKSV